MHLEFITGAAGTGKTTLVRNQIAEAKKKGVKNYATLTATTGIAAINLSGGSGETVTTINSELGYFNTESLREVAERGKLVSRIKKLAKKCKVMITDEISMFGKDQMEIIYKAFVEANEDEKVSNRGGIGWILVGDFCQLPPIKAEFAFHAKCFKNFKITKLEKIWRQDNLDYINALNYARCGDGERASKGLMDLVKAEKDGANEGIRLRSAIDLNFEGTTIVALNRLVDEFNELRFKKLLEDKVNTKFEFQTKRWGQQLSEWKNIPETIVTCKNAYVMILANDSPAFSYANGSCGHVIDANIDQGRVVVKLVDGTRATVTVRRITRRNTQRDTPMGCIEPEAWLSWKEWRDKEVSGIEEYNSKLQPGQIGMEVSDEFTLETQYKAYLIQLTARQKQAGQPYFDYDEEKWVIGEVTYTPIRLAYATTCHKSQGLSLDRVQIDYSNDFFGAPSMSYVALSRCRTPEGLTLVGNRKLIEDRTNISEEILEWL